MCPHKPMIPCKKQGCFDLTNDPGGYCPQHKRELQRGQDKARGSSTQRGYDRRWRKARTRYLKEHPLCAECVKEGWVTVATVVDHIIPAKGSANLFWDENNWQPLCKFHHDRKTAREDGAFGNEEKIR